MSCPSKACDWTTGSHSNSNQLTDKCIWDVVCFIIFMATDDFTERFVYTTWVGTALKMKLS